MSEAVTFAGLLKGDLTGFKCTICRAQAGTCDCWTKCQRPGCTWSFRKGTACRNPAHESDHHAR